MAKNRGICAAHSATYMVYLSIGSTLPPGAGEWNLHLLFTTKSTLRRVSVSFKRDFLQPVVYTTCAVFDITLCRNHSWQIQLYLCCLRYLKYSATIARRSVRREQWRRCSLQEALPVNGRKGDVTSGVTATKSSSLAINVAPFPRPIAQVGALTQWPGGTMPFTGYCGLTCRTSHRYVLDRPVRAVRHPWWTVTEESQKPVGNRRQARGMRRWMPETTGSRVLGRPRWNLFSESHQESCDGRMELPRGFV